MGLCASASAAEADQTHPQKPVAAQSNGHAVVKTVQPAAEPKQSSAAAAAPAPAASAASSSSSSGLLADDEYRSQLKSIFLFILDRLTQTMDYEKAGFRALAAQQHGDSYLDLFHAAQVEQFIRAVFDVASEPSVPATAGATDREEAFSALVKAAQATGDSKAPGTRGVLDRAAFTAAIKEVCTATQGHLRAAAATLETPDVKAKVPRAAELQNHLAFFLKTLNFTQGDISGDAKLLEKNVDDILAA